MRGLEKNNMKRDRYIDRQIDGHRDSMKESAKGRFFEKLTGVLEEFYAGVCQNEEN